MFILGLGVVFLSSSLTTYADVTRKDHSITFGARFDTKARPFYVSKNAKGNLWVYLPDAPKSPAKVKIDFNKFLLINAKQLGFKNGDKVHYAIHYKLPYGGEAIQHTSTCNGSIMLKKDGKKLKSIGLFLTPKKDIEYLIKDKAPWFECKLVPVYDRK